MIDWSKVSCFQRSEFTCSHCGEERMDERFIRMLVELRHGLGFPIFINSGYRCKDHPVEAAKPGGPGTHSRGIAADVRISGEKAWALLARATWLNFRGFGIHQHGEPEHRWIHLDIAESKPGAPRPTIWTYPS